VTWIIQEVHPRANGTEKREKEKSTNDNPKASSIFNYIFIGEHLRQKKKTTKFARGQGSIVYLKVSGLQCYFDS